MEDIALKKNDSVTLIAPHPYTCRFAAGEAPYLLEEIVLPQYGQTLTIRDVIKVSEGIGFRFWEIYNPRFPHHVPALGPDTMVDLEPLFAASRFSAALNSFPDE